MVQVGDGAAHLEDAVVSTGGEAHALHGTGEDLRGFVIEPGILFEQCPRHLRVAVDALQVLVPFSLDVARCYHPLAYLLAALAGRCLRQVGDGNGGYLHLNVDAIEEIMVCLFHSLCTCVFEI